MTHHQQSYTHQPNQFYFQPNPYPGATLRQNQSQPETPTQLPMEQSYIENIFRLNRGKMATVYMTFDSGNEGRQKKFRGRVEAAGRDHLILSDPDTNKRYLLLMVYLDYATFDERIDYAYPFGSTEPLATYPSRS